MDSDTFSNIVGGAVLVGILIFIYLAYRRRRLRVERLQLMELLKGYFQGKLPAEQLGSRWREMAGYYFMREAELYALVTAAFQGAVDAKVAQQGHSKEDQGKLLGLLATLKKEFGLPDRYQIEAWRPGRE